MILRTILLEFTDDPKDIRNNGLGDYFYKDEDNTIIRAYQKDKKPESEGFANLCAFHELSELFDIKRLSIDEKIIDQYDRMIDQVGGMADEAGNEPDCPYKDSHRFAENMERLLAYQLGIDWFDYYNNYQIE